MPRYRVITELIEVFSIDAESSDEAEEDVLEGDLHPIEVTSFEVTEVYLEKPA